jgi:glycosyltransferase involved in cell wall biosynthesis
VLRDEVGARERDVLVGIVGRLTEIKNHSLFLQAAARYKEKRAEDSKSKGDAGSAQEEAPRVRFLVIGDGHLSATLRKEAERLGLMEDMLFMGQRDDAENFYPGLDIVALTSLNEGTPLTLIEAMANERAVLSVKVGGVVDLVGAEHGASVGASEGYTLCERGVLVPTHDPQAFARALAFLVEDERVRREMGEKGRRFVERSYSKERLISDVTKLYDELLHREGAASSNSSSGLDLSQPSRLRAIKTTTLKED